MRFVPSYKILELPKENFDIPYKQQINTTIFRKSNFENQSSERFVTLSYDISTNSKIEVYFTTEKLTLQLDSIYRKQEEIIARIHDCFTRVGFGLDLQGNLISILNHEEILSRWIGIRDRITRDFQGKTVSDYLNKIDKKLKNKKQLLNELRQYRMYGLYFNGLYKEKNLLETEEKSSIHILQNAFMKLPLAFVETQISKDSNTDESISIHLKGSLDEHQPNQREINEVLHQNNLIKIDLKTYDGTYILNNDHSLPQHVSLKIETVSGEVYNKAQEFIITQQ